MGMRIGIHGAGSIGCYVGGMLLAARAADVTLVGRARLGDELAAHGLTVADFDRASRTIAPGRVRFATEPAALADCDAVLVCVKSAQTAEVARALAPILRKDAVVASLQNGVRNADVLRAQLAPRAVLPAIVGFNVISRGDGRFQRTTSMPLTLGADPAGAPLVAALAAAGLDVKTTSNLAAHQWTKLLVNLNNAVSALSGAPTREILLSPGYRKVVAALVSEALGVLRAAGIRPAPLQGIPVGLMPKVLRLPTPIVRLVTRTQMKVDPSARSSMWEDLTKGRPTEVDYLNGEIVRLAEGAGRDAPLNRRVVDLVHAAEGTGPGSPNLSADALWAAISARPGGADAVH
jgi:2-dehydropantoate 2-reductase